jgi:hypothetical protein
MPSCAFSDDSQTWNSTGGVTAKLNETAKFQTCSGFERSWQYSSKTVNGHLWIRGLLSGGFWRVKKFDFTALAPASEAASCSDRIVFGVFE